MTVVRDAGLQPMAYFCVQLRAVVSYFDRSVLYIWAISGTRGSSGLGSVSREQIESNTCNIQTCNRSIIDSWFFIMLVWINTALMQVKCKTQQQENALLFVYGHHVNFEGLTH
jgi:hypothetical protein